MSFHFVGQIPASKSVLNRALILNSYTREKKKLSTVRLSRAEDVVLMEQALDKLASTNSYSQRVELDCGHAGTVLRFLAFRVSREKARFRLKGSKRLFSRPLDDLKKVLMQLGAVVQAGETYLDIDSDGWRLMGDQLYIPADKSSQFASGFLLNSWELPFEVFFRTSTHRVSEPYFQMTWEMVVEMGLKPEVVGDGEFHLPARQKMKTSEVHIEPDMSSAFALAACAAVAGELRLTHWPKKSLQPDFRFVQILKSMGIPIRIENKSENNENDQRLEVSKASQIKPVKLNLIGAPDLFPVLVALCALAEGPSEFTGVEHLAYKESSRAKNMQTLLSKIGVKSSFESGVFKVYGRGLELNCKAFSFDPDEDHRIFMAATVLKLAGVPIEVLHPEVVNKSFPEFVGIVEGGL